MPASGGTEAMLFYWSGLTTVVSCAACAMRCVAYPALRAPCVALRFVALRCVVMNLLWREGPYHLHHNTSKPHCDLIVDRVTCREQLITKYPAGM